MYLGVSIMDLGSVSAKFAGALIFQDVPLHAWENGTGGFWVALRSCSGVFAHIFEAHPKLAAYYNFSVDVLVFAQLLIMEDVSGEPDYFLRC